MQISKLLTIVVFAVLLTVFPKMEQRFSFGADPIPEVPDGQPNEEFRDLLTSPLLSAKFGTYLVPFGKEITVEALVKLPIGNQAYRMRSRGLVLVSSVDGQTTDESHTQFMLPNDRIWQNALAAGKRYRLKGRIRHGYQRDGWSIYCFEPSEKPQLIKREHPEQSVKLLNLDEFISKDVSLVGHTLSLNGHWFFRYGEQNMIINQIRKRPGWEVVDHGTEVRVKGKLTKELRPSLDQISLKTCRDLVPHFVIKQAEIELVSTGRSLMFTEVYSTTPRFRDGVLDLHNGYGVVYNLMPWMNRAMLLYRRNADLIPEIVRRDSPTTRSVLRKRMNDKKRDETLRLLDAGMLAAMNDESGRKFLKNETKKSDPVLPSVYWVIGNLYRFSPLPPTPETATTNRTELLTNPDGTVDMTNIVHLFLGPVTPERPLGQVDMRWAEQLMIDAISSKKLATANELGVDPANRTERELAVIHGSFPSLLIKLKSKKAIMPLCEFAVENTDNNWKVLTALLTTKDPRVIEFARNNLRKTKRRSDARRAFQALLLPSDRQIVIDDLIESIDQTYAFDALRSLPRAEVLPRLDAQFPQLDKEARENVRLLKLLFSDDPQSALLNELDRKNGINPNFVLYYLPKYADETTVRRVAALLRTAPKKYFEADGLSGLVAIPRAIDLCAMENSHESLETLISLLGAIDRFDELPKNGDKLSIPVDYDNYVAAKLIELTGISFGTDKAKWEQWLAEQVR